MGTIQYWIYMYLNRPVFLTVSLSKFKVLLLMPFTFSVPFTKILVLILRIRLPSRLFHFYRNLAIYFKLLLAKSPLLSPISPRLMFANALTQYHIQLFELQMNFRPKYSAQSFCPSNTLSDSFAVSTYPPQVNCRAQSSSFCKSLPYR